MDIATRNTLLDTLRSDPAERDKFIANTAQYLTDIGVPVPKSSGKKNVARAGNGPPVPGLLILGGTSPE
jgi:hypothetical protein